MEFMTFMAGGIVGGSIFAIGLYYLLKAQYEKKVSESYTKGYKDGREIEQRSILEYIDQLKGKPDEGKVVKSNASDES